MNSFWGDRVSTHAQEQQYALVDRAYHQSDMNYWVEKEHCCFLVICIVDLKLSYTVVQSLSLDYYIIYQKLEIISILK